MGVYTGTSGSTHVPVAEQYIYFAYAYVNSSVTNGQAFYYRYRFISVHAYEILCMML
jgi:hypothetical protein